jgi:hypothetical protein
MEKLSRSVILMALITFSSCTPLITTKLETKLPSADPKQEIKVLEINTEIPLDAVVIGTVKIGDSGVTINCGYQVVLDRAKLEARKAGGNAIKITEHIPPGFSTCHRITAKILRIYNSNTTPLAQIQAETPNHNFAVLNIYSVTEPGTLLNYDLHLGDSVLCRVNNNLKTTIAIKKDGIYSLWAMTDVKSEIPIDIKFGSTYYLRCRVLKGAMADSPVLELVEPEIGSQEFDIFKPRSK